MITMISTIIKVVLVISNLYVAFHYTTFYPLTITVTAIIVLEHNKRQREKAQRHKIEKTKKILSCLGDLDVMVGDGERGGEDCDDSGGSD